MNKMKYTEVENVLIELTAGMVHSGQSSRGWGSQQHCIPLTPTYSVNSNDYMHLYKHRLYIQDQVAKYPNVKDLVGVLHINPVTFTFADDMTVNSTTK